MADTQLWLFRPADTSWDAAQRLRGKVDLPATEESLAELRQRVMDRVFGGVSGPNTVAATRRFGPTAWAAAAAVALLALAGAAATTRQKESVVVRDARPKPQELNLPLEGYGEYAGVKAGVLWDSGLRARQGARLRRIAVAPRRIGAALCATGRRDRFDARLRRFDRTRGRGAGGADIAGRADQRGVAGVIDGTAPASCR